MAEQNSSVNVIIHSISLIDHWQSADISEWGLRIWSSHLMIHFPLICYIFGELWTSMKWNSLVVLQRSTQRSGWMVFLSYPVSCCLSSDHSLQRCEALGQFWTLFLTAAAVVLDWATANKVSVKTSRACRWDLEKERKKRKKANLSVIKNRTLMGLCQLKKKG